MAAAALLAAGFTAQAQTNTVTPVQSIFQSFSSYLLDVNTNWGFNSFLIWNEVDYQNQIDISDGLGASYDVLHPANYVVSSAASLSLEAVMRNIGVAGRLASGQGGIGVNWNHYNIRIGGYADGGYNETWHKAYCELGVRVLKKPTPNTFLGVGLSYDLPQLDSQQNYPLVGVFGGISF